jgi:8-oxo-dGTP pyrophosphatase MutT (NUDIX family)
VNRTAADGEGYEVEAAGGVIVRDHAGEPRIAVIHRPKHDDWSFPKGKLEPGEGWLDAALREVEEETGLRCRALRELSTARYRDRHDRPKLVRYWLMEPLGGEFAPRDEVDEIRWLGQAEAAELLSYENDRELLREALESQR